MGACQTSCCTKEGELITKTEYANEVKASYHGPSAKNNVEEDINIDNEKSKN